MFFGTLLQNSHVTLHKLTYLLIHKKPCINSKYIDKQLYIWGETLNNQHDVSGNIASNGNLFDGHYDETLALS
jgi:hypothetical protein